MGNDKVLVLQGAKDIQVFVNEDTPLLDAALKSRTPDDHQVVIVPGASHNMKFVQDPTRVPVSPDQSCQRSHRRCASGWPGNSRLLLLEVGECDTLSMSFLL